MDIKSRYTKIIEVLQKGHRFLEPLTTQQLEYLSSQLETADSQQLKQIFCILDNTRTASLSLQRPLIDFLKRTDVSADLIIFALDATRKHVIDASWKVGKRLQADYLIAIQNMLQRNNPETLEWTLRVIEECGSQSIFFRRDVNNVRPSFFKLYNKHNRAVLELCEYLERRWSRGDRKD
jgi:hypothetical protein